MDIKSTQFYCVISTLLQLVSNKLLRKLLEDALEGLVCEIQTRCSALQHDESDHHRMLDDAKKDREGLVAEIQRLREQSDVERAKYIEARFGISVAYNRLRYCQIRRRVVSTQMGQNDIKYVKTFETLWNMCAPTGDTEIGTAEALHRIREQDTVGVYLLPEIAARLPDEIRTYWEVVS